MHITISQQAWIANVIASEWNFIYVYHIGHVMPIIILWIVIKLKYTKIFLRGIYTVCLVYVSESVAIPCDSYKHEYALDYSAVHIRMAKASNTNESFLMTVRSQCLLLRKDFTFCFNISTGVWWAFSFLFLSRIFLFSWPGEGSMGSSEKSLSNKNFVTNFSPNTFWNIENMWCIMKNPKTCA